MSCGLDRVSQYFCALRYEEFTHDNDVATC